jgi:hypothetical protein
MSVSMRYFPFPGILFASDRPTPHKKRWLLVVSPDMAEVLAVVTLRETSLDFVRLYPDCNMAKTPQLQYLMGL